MKASHVREEVRRFLKEDIGYGDITTELIGEIGKIEAEIVAKEDFVVSGIREAGMVFEETGAAWTSEFRPGDLTKKGDLVMEILGPARAVLTAERLALNILMRMSGIATAVKRLAELAGETKVAATRKTTPGFRYFEKKAVFEGGGDTHRYRLDDMFLIKDNHIAACGLEEVIDRAKKASMYKKIEVEVSSVDDAIKAAELGTDMIMLDNMSPSQARESFNRVKEIDNKIMIEISGNIDENNIAEYAPYADVISCGFITHSVRSVDVSLRITCQE